MARVLNLKLEGKEYSAEPMSIDRKKLYGWTEVLALDDDGNECSIATMDESGTVIIPPKGTAQAIVDKDKNWVDKSLIKAVTLDGKDAEQIPSSYEIVVDLDKTTTVEDYLDHTIHQFYELCNIQQEMLDKMKDKIYTFTYSYSKSYEGKTAFILINDNRAFMLVGTKCSFQMLGLQEQSVITEEADEEEESSDEFDFSNMF